MKIKINSKNYKIKPASELTVKEYAQYFDSLKDDSGNLERLICYITAITGLKYNNVADININEPTIRRLFAFIGDIQQANDIPINKEFYYKRTGKVLYQKTVNWQTIGARKLLEERKTDSTIEQVVYLLAVYLSDDYDNEKVEEIYQELQDYNAIDVLSFVVFFFKRLSNGKHLGRNFLRRPRIRVSTSTAKRLSKLQGKD